MSLDQFLTNNASAPHVVYVGSTGGGSVTHTISAVNEDSLRILAGEESVAEQIGTFKLGLASSSDGGTTSELRSTGTLDSYGYETDIMGNSLRFHPHISGVATQSIDTVVGLSGDIGDNDDEGVAPEPTVVVKGGFIVDENGSVIGQTKMPSSSSPSASTVRRPTRAPPPAPKSASTVKRPTRTPPPPPTPQDKGPMTIGELMMKSPSSSAAASGRRAKVVSTQYLQSDTSWRKDNKDKFSTERKLKERATRKGRGQRGLQNKK
jgi:hypothetical protein